MSVLVLLDLLELANISKVPQIVLRVYTIALGSGGRTLVQAGRQLGSHKSLAKECVNCCYARKEKRRKKKKRKKGKEKNLLLRPFTAFFPALILLLSFPISPLSPTCMLLTKGEERCSFSPVMESAFVVAAAAALL